MDKNVSLNFFDYILLILKYKQRIVSLFLVSAIVSYLSIFFFMKPKFDSTATLIPANQDAMAGIFSLVSSFSAALPGGLSSLTQDTDMNLYNTVIFSRTSLELIMNKFELQKRYHIKKKFDMLKMLKKMIKAKTTLDNAYVIKVRTDSPELSANICNHIVDYLNNRIIELNISKSKENRQFLEKRYNEVGQKLTAAEDALKMFQMQTGVIEAELQAKTALELFAKLESDLAVKQVEAEILTQIHGVHSQQVQNAKISIKEYSKKLSQMHNGNDSTSVFLGISTIPEKTISFYRLYRDVKIQTEIVNFLVPLLEQARFEEQKTLPILQIIDEPDIPEQKAFPPRTLFALISALIITFLTTILMFFSQILSITKNEKLILIKEHLLFFK